MRAFVEASEAVGLTHVSDFNGATQYGVGPYPLNVVDGVRINTGMAYLTAAVRARPNLAIRGDAEVDGVAIEGKRAVGVKLVDEALSAGEVILAAGVLGSPAILMRHRAVSASVRAGHRDNRRPAGGRSAEGSSLLLQRLCAEARSERDEAGRGRDHLNALADRGASKRCTSWTRRSCPTFRPSRRT